MSRKDLQNAKDAKQDEFYTQLNDIELELKHYKDFFKGKIVLCNCDDPFESNFFKYFAMNFNYLQLKKLICTCYDGSSVVGEQLSIFDFIEEKDIKEKRTAYKIEITEVKDLNEDGATDLYDVESLIKNDKNILTKLKENGDFRSPECIELLKEADVVVTNPPFSLFREYVAKLVEYNKKFLIIGNQNAITYKEIFPLFQQNKLWLGVSIHSGDREFRIPDNYEVRSKSLRVDEKGNKYIRVVGVRWFTNIDNKDRHEKLTLYKKYNPDDYPKYENYDAINVNKTSDIPDDYYECIGVPITFLDKYNPDQFEIIRFRKGDDDKDLVYLRERESMALLSNHYKTKKEFLIKTMIRYGLKEEDLDYCNGEMGVPITFLDKFNHEQFELIALGIVGSIKFSCDRRMEILDKNGNGTGKYTVNAKGTLYRKWSKLLDKNKPAAFRDCETGELYQSIYARVIIKRRLIS